MSSSAPDDATGPVPAASPAPSVETPDPRRWKALAVLVGASLMIVLDASVINIALPHAQADLRISDGARQWAITAYAIAFGALLLLGGRIADYLGRKRAFIVGLVGFAVASALGGAATAAWTLFATRGLQGAFAAVLAPAALALITTSFTDDRERRTAFGVYGAVQGAGGAIGLLLGGVLTDVLSWRWCLFINVPIAVVTVLGALPLVRDIEVARPSRFDLTGTVLATSGLVAVVWALARVGTPGATWGSPSVWLPLVLGVVLLVIFVIVERRVDAPLLPMRVLADRSRGLVFAALALIGAGMFGLLLILTFYLQDTLGYSPLQTGFAFLPFSAGIVIASTVAGPVSLHFGQGPTLAAGAIMAVTGTAWLTATGADQNYFTVVFGATVIMALGLGLIFTLTANLALGHIRPEDAGVASSLLNITQQVGGALGTALLNSLAATATSVTGVTAGVADPVQGSHVALTAATVLFAVGGALLVISDVVGANSRTRSAPC